MIFQSLSRHWLTITLISLILTACQEQTDARHTPLVEIKPSSHAITESALPHVDKPYMTDQYKLPTGINVQLWQENGACQLQLDQQAKQPLALKAPCRFMRSPASDTIQVFKADVVIRIFALVGDPTEQKQCGTKARGIIVRGKTVYLAAKVLEGVFCTHKGLENANYMQFLKP